MKYLHRMVVACVSLFAAGMMFVLIPPLPLAPQHRQLPAISTSGVALNITVFGTSLSTGTDWPDNLGQALQPCLDRPVIINRITGPGAGSGWALTMLTAVVETNPDLVIMEFAINDADMRDGVWLKTSIEQHRQLIANLRADAPHTQILLMTTNPAYGLRGVMRPRLRAYYKSYRILAASMNTGLADIYGQWLTVDKALRKFPDGLHPTDEAATTVILPILAPMITKALKQNCIAM